MLYYPKITKGKAGSYLAATVKCGTFYAFLLKPNARMIRSDESPAISYGLNGFRASTGLLGVITHVLLALGLLCISSALRLSPESTSTAKCSKCTTQT